MLTLAFDRVPRSQWPELLSRADSTVKHTITTLLRKVGAESLQELTVRVQAPRAANDGPALASGRRRRASRSAA